MELGPSPSLSNHDHDLINFPSSMILESEEVMPSVSGVRGEGTLFQLINIEKGLIRHEGGDTRTC